MTDPLPPASAFLPYEPHPDSDAHLQAVVELARERGGNVTLQDAIEVLGEEVAQNGLFTALGRDVMTTGPIREQPYKLAERFL